MLLGVDERALDGYGRWALCAYAVPLGAPTCDWEAVRACGGGTACRAGVEGFRGCSGDLTPKAGFVSGCRKQSGQRDVRAKLTSVCFRSILAKGLRFGCTLLGAVPFASLIGLSGGGVASCGIGLKLL